MKERPILMNDDMVRAILEGRKTQTRRPVTGIPLEWLQPGMFSPIYVALPENHLSPFGYAGDRLWVRETWHVVERENQGVGRQFVIFSDEWSEHFPNEAAPLRPCYGQRFGCHPSIHMPREFSRIMLEVTDVRVQRLWEITDADCWAEGITQDAYDEAEHFAVGGSSVRGGSPERCAYASIWDSIYAKRDLGWDVNPWVWAVTFQRTEDR